MALKLLFLSMHYRPEPCDTRTSQLAEAFAARGHRSTVLTSFPNYPFGKIYPGYRQKLCQRESVNGVELLRVPMLADHSRSTKKRALSYLSFGATAATIGSLVTGRPDLIWIHHPPLGTGLAGCFMATLKRVPYVYEIHDLWPETLMSTGMIKEGRLTRAIRNVCGFLHKRAAAVVVTSPGMKEHLVRQGLSESKIHVFPQWATGDEAMPGQRDLAFGKAHGLDGKFNVLFTGNIGIAQNLDTVIDAAHRLQDHPDVQIIFVGAGVDLARLEKRVEDERLTNVRFVGQVDQKELPNFFAWADGLLVHLKDDPLFTITIPSKVQLYMSVGRPILCGAAGDAANLIDSCNGGITFPPEDAEAMAGSIRQLRAMSSRERDELGRNARIGYDSHCSRETLVGAYEALFHKVLGLGPKLAVVEGSWQPAAEEVA